MKKRQRLPSKIEIAFSKILTEKEIKIIDKILEENIELLYGTCLLGVLLKTRNKYQKEVLKYNKLLNDK